MEINRREGAKKKIGEKAERKQDRFGDDEGRCVQTNGRTVCDYMTEAPITGNLASKF